MAAPKKDIKGRVMGSRRLFEQLESWIPGFSGYKEKELRREADKLLRMKLAEQLKQVDSKIDAAYEDMVDSKMTGSYSTMNAITALMDKIIGKVEMADYGYAGFFSAIKIKEDALDAVYEFDSALFADVEDMGKIADGLASEITDESEGIPKTVKELKAAVNDFDKKFDKRKDVLLRLE